MLAIISDIRDLSKVEAGRLETSRMAIDIAEIVEECCNLIRSIAAKRNISIHVRIPKSLHIAADRVRLKQILINFLSNAVKYNRDDGRIDIEATQTGVGQVRINVRDSGNGIPPERLGELYKPFNRLGTETSGIEGTGIGLALSKRLAEVMGGTEIGRASCRERV